MAKERLRLEMRAGERRPICEFELNEGETLAERVKAEIAIAAERGDIPPMAMSATIPSIAVFEADENDRPIGSVAVFSAKGNEVSYRDYKVKIGKEGGSKDVIQLTVTDQEDGNPDKTIEKVLGVFYDEQTARIVGSLWKSGVLD